MSNSPETAVPLLRISRRDVLAGLLVAFAAPGAAEPRPRVGAGAAPAGGSRARVFRRLARLHHTTTRTDFGTVVAGGYHLGALSSVQVFDGERWREAPPLLTARFHHAAAPFSGGVLVAGGISSAGATLSDAEVCDGQRWQRLPSLRLPRSQAAALAWSEGALVSGGRNAAPLSSVEVFDGASWQTVASLTIPRYGHTADLVRGAARVAGGFNRDRISAAEWFDGTRWAREPAAAAREVHSDESRPE